MNTPRRLRSERVLNLRERERESDAGPARWPADGWSLGSLAHSGRGLAWASVDGSFSRSSRDGRRVAWEVARPASQNAGSTGTKDAAATTTSARAARPSSSKEPGRSPAPRKYTPEGLDRYTPESLGLAPQTPAAPVAPPASAPRPSAPRPSAPRPPAAPAARKIDDRPRHAAIGQSPRVARHAAPAAAAANRPAASAASRDEAARWKVIDLTEPESKLRVAASSDLPVLPRLFRLDPLHSQWRSTSAADSDAEADPGPVYRRVGEAG